MDDFGDELSVSNNWQQWIGYICGEFSFFTGQFFPLWSEAE